MPRFGVVYFWCMHIIELYTMYREVDQKVCTDTRNIIPGSIFFALKGANFNGNTFAPEAIAQGCRYAIVDEPVDNAPSTVIRVENVLKTLQELATHHRRQFKIPIIGLTGSNGKTTTKELMAAVLSRKYKVHATKGNLNNHIGVPLTLLAMREDTEIAIIEMGANGPNDIGELCEIAEPEFGLITNIGRAHLEGFGGVDGVIRAKGQLFDYLRKHHGKVFVHASDYTVVKMAEGLSCYSYSSDANKGEISGRLSPGKLFVTFNWKGKSNEENFVQTKLTGGYNLPNLLAAVAVGNFFDVNAADINAGLEHYVPRNNRSQVQKTADNTLIMDAYNANPSSVEKALTDFASLSFDGEKLAILGDMLELGTESEKEHNAILQLAVERNIPLALVGKAYKAAVKSSLNNFSAFENVDQAAEYFTQHKPVNKLILIKGSRGIQLEKLIDVL